MKRILVTGGNGLVGSQFVGEQYVYFSSKDCDLRNVTQTENLFKDDWDAIIHCAAKVGGLGGNMNFKGEFFYDNIMMNTNVIESARKFGVKNLVAFLSTCIFPAEVEYPLTEKKIQLGPPHTSNDAYAYAKRMADVQIRAYREQYGLNYKCVIPTNIYGPHDNFDIENGHVVPSLIHKCYIAKRDNTDLVVWGTGNPLREFIFSQNIGSLTQRILDEYEGAGPIILSTSEEISIRELVETIAKAMDYRGKIIFDSTKPDGQYRKPTSNRKLMSFLPKYKFTSLENGINRTVDWFVNNYRSCRK